MTTEYTQLVGEGTTGDFVKETQGVAEGFSNVSQFWIPNTLSYEDCLNQLEAGRSSREDINSKWEDWEFVLDGNRVGLKHNDDRVFFPTEHALNQAIGWSEVSQTHIKQTLSPEFQADETDLSQLVDMLNYRKQRNHMTNKNEERELIFRTYNDNTLRAVLTKQFTAIDNRWVIELMRDLIPGGRVSHLRGDSDTIYTNILLPDNVRYEEDSGYGGMFAIKNSEIGRASFDTRPSLFRAICMNGCIWSETKGVSYRQVHKGKINLEVLALEVSENLDKQIKIVPEIMDNFLKLRRYEFHEVAMGGVFAAIAERFKLTTGQISEVATQFARFEKDSRSAFGVINSITRAGQLYDAEICNKFDMLGGQLISENWDKLVNTAKSYSESEWKKVLGVSA